MRSGAFARELELDRLDAAAGEAVADYLGARWRERAADIDRAPPLPDLFQDAAVRNRLDRWRGQSRRAEMLWRWYTTAHIEATPAVRAAMDAADGPGLIAARNAAARALGRKSYWHLGLELAELSDPPVVNVDVDVDGPAPELDLAQLDPESAVAQICATFATLGLPPTGIQLDASLDANPDAPVRARTFPVAPPADVRVYVRAPHAPAGWRVFAHELGHALYARHHAADAPWSLRAAPSRAAHEGVACFVEGIVVAPDPGAVEAQRARTDAERRVYLEHGDEVRPWMMYDPLAQPAYLAARAIGAALLAASSGMQRPRVGPWLVERVLGPGASLSAAQLFARV